jgi:hypothetical protein
MSIRDMPTNKQAGRVVAEDLGIDSETEIDETDGPLTRARKHTMARVVQGLGASAVTLYVIILITGQVGDAITGVNNGSAYFDGALSTVDGVTESSFILAAVGLIVLVGGALIAAVRGFGGGGGMGGGGRM